MLVKPQQMRAARALLGWSQAELAERAGVAELTVINFEGAKSTPTAATLEKLMLAVDTGGVELLSNGGVAPISTRVKHYRGSDDFRRFFDDIYLTAKNEGGSICLFNGVPPLLIKWLGSEWYKAHAERMREIKDKFTFNVIVNEDESGLIGSSFANYRFFPKELFSNKTIYIYGNKIGFINFSEADVDVTVLEQADTANAMRVLFDISWQEVAREIK